MHIIFNILFLIGAIKWGDWKNWRDYYPTILFFIGGDLLKNFLFHDYRMWEYKETIFAEDILFSHTVINLMIMLVVYPSTILVYLGKFPRTRARQILWIAFFVLLYSSIEFINVRYLDLFDHFHGWTIGWSIAFNVVMFTVLRIHYRKPLAAWGMSVIWFLFLWNTFDIPREILK